jgi:hypothetical protein
MFERAGVRCPVVDDVDAAQWEKLSSTARSTRFSRSAARATRAWPATTRRRAT